MSKENGNKGTAKNATDALTIVWSEGFFKNWQNLASISKELSSRGNHFSSMEIGVALIRTKFLTRRGKRGTYEYIQKRPPISKEVESVENELFADSLVKKLGKSFSSELADLRLNFDRSGNCSAFLLRKILEKLIYITFARNNLQPKLEDKSRPGGLVGLETMVNIAAIEKIRGIPFIVPKTAQEIKGIKFLGDAAAHNPLVDIDMKTIIPQMPFIITAYKELAYHL